MNKDVKELHSKLDRIMETTSDTKEKVAVIEEHLKNLNSKVAKNVDNIEKQRVFCEERRVKNDKELYDVKIKLVALVTLGASIVTAVTNFAVTYFRGGL